MKKILSTGCHFINTNNSKILENSFNLFEINYVLIDLALKTHELDTIIDRFFKEKKRFVFIKNDAAMTMENFGPYFSIYKKLFEPKCNVHFFIFENDICYRWFMGRGLSRRQEVKIIKTKTLTYLDL
jgi:hypothetical protein